MGHASRGHSLVSPSQCARFWVCPGSVRRCALSNVEDTPSKYAAEGTKAHEFAEYCIKNGVGPKSFAEDYAPFGGGKKAETFITTEMADAVQAYIDEIRADLAKYGLGLESLIVEATLPIEFRPDEEGIVPADSELDMLLELEPVGSCDAYFVAPDGTVYVYDLKYGKGHVVSAVENKQMMYYAAGVSEAVLGSDSDTYVLKIIQPRAFVGDVEQVWLTNAAAVKQFRKDLRQKILDCSSMSAPLVADKDGCYYCKGKLGCPALNSDLEDNMSAMFQPIVGRPDISPSPTHTMTVEVPNFGTLTPVGLAEYLDKIEKLRNLLDSLHSEAYNTACAMAVAGNDIPGYRVEQKKGNRKWTNEDRVLEALNAVGVDAIEPKLKSPAQIEKQLKQSGVEFDLDDWTIRETKDPVLVRNEKLDPVNLTMFKPVNQ